ncbi:MAG: hypothetical protein QM605_13390 [Sphingobium sp.]
MPTEDENNDRLMAAINHIREAILLCEEAGFDIPACHLQLGLDLLEEYRSGNISPTES